MAQEVGAAFIAAGLDPDKYGLFCYDKWDAVDEVKDDEGNILQHAIEAGDRYGIRYEELLAFIISCFYSKNMDITFLMMFITLSLFFYIVFYYLGSTRESYTNYNKFYTNNYHSYDNSNNHILRDHLEESEHVEEELEDKINLKKNTIKKYLKNQN
jgi:hypothetical protein